MGELLKKHQTFRIQYMCQDNQKILHPSVFSSLDLAKSFAEKLRKNKSAVSWEIWSQSYSCVAFKG